MDHEITFILQESEHFPGKINCPSKLTPIQLIKEKLSEEQLRIFKRSCFGRLIDIQDLQFQGQLLHHLILRQISSPHDDEIWFALSGSRPFRFSIHEFGLITGLSCAPYPDIQSTGNGSFCGKMLHGIYGYNTKALEAIFLGAQTENDEDMVKLALLYFLEAVLLGKDHKNRISKEHVKLLDDMDAFNNFPWGRRSYDMTLSSMKKDFKKKATEYQNALKESQQKQGQKKKATAAAMYYSLCGFPYAFQVIELQVIAFLFIFLFDECFLLMDHYIFVVS